MSKQRILRGVIEKGTKMTSANYRNRLISHGLRKNKIELKII